MIRLKTKLTMAMSYSGKLQKGQKVKINAVSLHRHCQSGVRFRVVTGFSTPTWFDVAWFKDPIQGIHESEEELKQILDILLEE